MAMEVWAVVASKEAFKKVFDKLKVIYDKSLRTEEEMTWLRTAVGRKRMTNMMRMEERMTREWSITFEIC